MVKQITPTLIFLHTVISLDLWASSWTNENKEEVKEDDGNLLLKTAATCVPVLLQSLLLWVKEGHFIQPSKNGFNNNNFFYHHHPILAFSYNNLGVE